ncbi:MAG TPA: hypothetical protein VIK54_06540 [Acidimicrobiia bacterium]
MRHQRGPRPDDGPDRYRRWQAGDEPRTAPADGTGREVEIVTSGAAALWISRDTHTRPPEQPPGEPTTMGMTLL